MVGMAGRDSSPVSSQLGTKRNDTVNRRLPLALPAVALLGLAGALAMPAQAAPAQIAFQKPVQLMGPRGGEPSIATDGKGNVYVSGPQGIPSGAARSSGPNPLPVGPSTIPNGSNAHPGVGFWVSHDHGATFGDGVLLGSYLGGGDSDVQVAPDDGTVGLLDLEAAASAVCFSHDGGATFQSASQVPDATNCSKLPSGQAGPSDDREWLTLGKGGVAYVTYHEFFSAQPLIFKTNNLGQDAFAAGPCGSIIDPKNTAIEANVPQDVTGGTLISKPILDSNGYLYVLFTTTTQQQNAANLPGNVSGTFSQIYLAVSQDGCSTFKDYTVFDGTAGGTISNSVQFGDIFNDIAMDGAGNLYAIGAGYIDSTPPAAPTADIFLFSSSDGGQTWNGPRQVTTDVGAHMMPAAVGGPNAGDLSIGYYRTVNGKTNPNDPDSKWAYTIAESTNALNAKGATFAFADLDHSKVFHAGDICTSGILCGTGLPGTGNDRSLADFTQATLDSDGCPIFTFAGNPSGTNDSAHTYNYVSKQTSGCFATTAAVAPAVVPSSQSGSGSSSNTVTPAVSTPNTSASRSSTLVAGAAVILTAVLLIGRRRRSARRR